MAKLKILMVASEAAPFVKEGGLGDVVGTLPKALAALGHDIRVVIPRYYKIDKQKYGLKPVSGILTIPMGIIGVEWGQVWEGRLPGSDIPVYFLEHEGYFGRDGLYGEHGEGYLDNDNRFVFLSKGGLELCRLIDFRPDIVHAHDWHTGVIPVLLNTSYRHDSHLWQASSVLSIHNMQYQGNFYEGLMDVLGIGWKHFNFLELEKDDEVNLLKGGLYHATMLTTVSEGYAREIQTPAYGWGLEGVVRDRAHDLVGILNGVDYDEWNPEDDSFIAANYSAADLSGKNICKNDLQRRFNLPQRDDVPVFGIVSRLVKQKGIDIVAEAIHRILALDVQVVLLGNGEPWSHFYFGDISAAYPEKFACHIGYSNELAHKIEAGADFFLMPSAFEPCGLNQMYSLRYGTLPVVRATGGLDDTVENFDERHLTGTGFKFLDLTAGALFDTIGWATHTWYNRKDAIQALMQNAMSRRFTWEDAAKKYEEVYLTAVRRKLGDDAFAEKFAAK